MIAYVVTSGCYSDYGIQRVFLEKEKAEKYVSLCDEDSDGYGCRIEEYEIDDDKEITEITYAEALYKIENNKLDYDFKILKTNSLDYEENYNNTKSYYKSSWRNEERISLNRVINNLSYKENELKDKYLKVCQDLYTAIQYNLSQGWNEKMINEWLKTVK